MEKLKMKKIQFAWLIEYRMAGKNDYWCCPNYHPDATKAIRFSRKEDAERVVKRFKGIEIRCPGGGIELFGCAPNAEIRIAEHGFYDNSE